MSKRRSLRRSLAVLILVLIVLGAGWTGVWYIVGTRLAGHLAAWEEQERAAGWVVTHDAPRRSGWPMAAGLTLGHFSMAGGRAYLPGGIAWQAESLTLALDIRHPNDLYLGVNGRQSLALAGGVAIPFQATRLIGRVALSSADQPGLVQLHAIGLLAALPQASGTHRASVGRRCRRGAARGSHGRRRRRRPHPGGETHGARPAAASPSGFGIGAASFPSMPLCRARCRPPGPPLIRWRRPRPGVRLAAASPSAASNSAMDRWRRPARDASNWTRRSGRRAPCLFG